MLRRGQTKTGFTIVELLIVIVIIGILAVITVVAYRGTKERAHMSQRASDVASIQKALELHRTTYGFYPAHIPATTASLPAGFAGSYSCPTCYSYSVVNDGNWLKNLTDVQTIAKAPVDPINNSGNFYMYWRSGPTGFATSCQEHFYILVVEAPGAGAMKNSKGVSCPTHANFTVGTDRAVFSNITGS